MVKSEIVSKLSDTIRPKIKKAEIEKILNIIVETIIQKIKLHKATEIRHFGRFSQKKIKERMNARNPRTGEIIQTKNKISIAFKMSKQLRIKINDGNNIN
jgi:nucleoid DNA-binding protein